MRRKPPESLVLAGNDFNGNSIPTSYTSLTSLQLLNMGSCNLTGFLDSSLANLVSLVELFLDDNMLSGTFPSALLTSPKLGTYNFIWQPLLCFFASLFDCLYIEKLYLSGNQLTGLIPNGLWRMTTLVELSLGSNTNMTGQIGTSIGNMVNLGKSTGRIVKVD